jgi:hypothetical protein
LQIRLATVWLMSPQYSKRMLFTGKVRWLVAYFIRSNIRNLVC